MSPAAAPQVNRIVTLVAELSRLEAEGRPAPTLQSLTERHGASQKEILADVRALGDASDEAGADWLSSLSILQEGDRLAIVSRGPFRRPIRFTADEALALQAGLAEEDEAPAAMRKALHELLSAGRGGAGVSEAPVGIGASAGSGEERIIAVAMDALACRQLLEIKYAGSCDADGEVRTVEPYQVVACDGHHYLVAWCRRAGGWRHFRIDRILDALPLGEAFEPRSDFEAVASPEQVFRKPAEGPEPVAVRFSPRIARWIVERYPAHSVRDDGAVDVTLPVSDTHWLVRLVLEYGEDAEVLGPAPYRAAMRRALG